MDKMIWIADIPKTSGYYWWRLGSRKKTYMTFVMNLKKGPKLVQVIDTDEGTIKYRFLEEMTGEWSECIDRPVDLVGLLSEEKPSVVPHIIPPMSIPKLIKDPYENMPKATNWADSVLDKKAIVPLKDVVQ